MNKIAGVQTPLLALALLNGVTFGVVITILAPYMYESGFTGTEFGLLTSVATVSSLALTIASGPLSDVLGARKVVAAAYALKFIAFTLFTIPDTLFLAIAFLLHGMSLGVSWSAGTALVARSSRDEQLHRQFTYFMASNMVGGAVGSLAGVLPPLLSSILTTDLLTAYRITIAIMAPLSLVQSVIALVIREDFGSSRIHASPRELATGFREAISDRRFKLLIAFNLVIGLGASMSIHNIGYYFAAKYGVTSAEIGVVNAVEQVAMAMTAVTASRLSERAGSILKVYVMLTSMSVPLLIAMTIVDSYALAAAIYVVRTVLMNAANPLLGALAFRYVPRRRRGAASSLFSLSFSMPATAGRALGGALLDVDLELPLRLTAVIYAIDRAYVYSKKGELEPPGEIIVKRREGGAQLAKAPQQLQASKP